MKLSNLCGRPPARRRGLAADGGAAVDGEGPIDGGAPIDAVAITILASDLRDRYFEHLF